MPELGPSRERVRAALDELLSWEGIARSPQLADLLRYVVEKTIAGDESSIKAYSIAVDVLGRAADFDPQSDPIVRVQARRLRTLIEQFYASGIGTADVEIRLPLGRYVPEFRDIDRGQGPAPVIDVETVPTDTLRRPRGGLSPFLTNAILGLVFTLVGVGLTVAAVRLLLPQTPQVVATIPEMPRIAVGPFDNLTGEPVLDRDVGQIGARLSQLLPAFENLSVGDGGLAVSGTVQQLNGRLALRAMVADPRTNGALWSTTILAPARVPDADALERAALELAAQLGNASGPLHAPGRAWLKLQTSLPDEPTPYLCDLLYMRWRDSRRLDDAEAGAACFEKLTAQSPDNAIALAAAAVMRAWRTQFLATSKDDLSKLMTDDTVAAGQAVTLAPNSSFVYEQQAVVLVRQGSVDAALGAIVKSLELNPASMDAMSVYGTLLWIAGQYSEAAAKSEESLAVIQNAPPWYYLTRAFNALREQRFFDAIDAAQALVAGDEEFGPIIALTAAPRAARSDLIDRYRPLVMGNPRFQVEGIIPRLTMRVRVPSIMQSFREGLILAGIPANALDRPFNADGSERKTVP